MSLFSKAKQVEAVLFSPLEGKLTYKGKPAANAKITLWTSWKDKIGETDTYHTDEQGNFSIPQKNMTYTPNFLAQLVMRQRLTVLFQGQEVVIWWITKMEETLFTELGGRPVNVRCELTHDEKIVDTDGSLGETRCQWDRLEKGVN